MWRSVFELCNLINVYSTLTSPFLALISPTFGNINSGAEFGNLVASQKYSAMLWLLGKSCALVEIIQLFSDVYSAVIVTDNGCLHRGSLEPGLEALFKAAGDELLSLKIVDCDSVVTARWDWRHLREPSSFMWTKMMKVVQLPPHFTKIDQPDSGATSGIEW